MKVIEIKSQAQYNKLPKSFKELTEVNINCDLIEIKVIDNAIQSVIDGTIQSVRGGRILENTLAHTHGAQHQAAQQAIDSFGALCQRTSGFGGEIIARVR